jgi:hypothetical protein
MPQLLLPLVPDGATRVSPSISLIQENGQWTWMAGMLPMFCHPQGDRASFRMFTTQLVCLGSCKQVYIVKACGVSVPSVKRAVKQYREHGPASFFEPRGVRGASVMTAAVIQQLLNQGFTRQETAQRLEIKVDTLGKAILKGKLTQPSATAAEEDSSPSPSNGSQTCPSQASDKSQRVVQDAAASEGLGVACTRVVERVSAAIGLLPGGAPTKYKDCRDVTFGGVLCALPALEQNGLFRHLDCCFPTLSGYYTTVQVFTLLGFMALCRIKAVGQLQYHPPGELGKLLGLDRIPEVRCLRTKLRLLSSGQSPEIWGARLSENWMQADPELAGALYIDGHVQLYHGRLTKLPPRFVSRQRLCLRGITNYWVNDALGQARCSRRTGSPVRPTISTPEQTGQATSFRRPR